MRPCSSFPSMQVRDPSPDAHLDSRSSKKCDGPTWSKKRRALVDRAGPATCGGPPRVLACPRPRLRGFGPVSGRWKNRQTKISCFDEKRTLETGRDDLLTWLSSVGRCDAPALGGRHHRGDALRPGPSAPGPPWRRGAGPRHDQRPDRRPRADHRSLVALDVSAGSRSVACLGKEEVETHGGEALQPGHDDRAGHEPRSAGLSSTESRERGDENRKAGVAVTPGRNGAPGEGLEIGHDPEARVMKSCPGACSSLIPDLLRIWACRRLVSAVIVLTRRASLRTISRRHAHGIAPRLRGWFRRSVSRPWPQGSGPTR